MRDYLDSRPIKIRGEQDSSSAPQRPLLLVLVFCFIAGGLLLLDQTGVLSPVRGVLEYISSPAARQLTGIRDSVAGWWSDISEIQRLREENKSLKRQVGQLQADLIAREQIVVENEHLRQQLDIEKRQPWQLLGAEVLVRSPDAGRRVMTIARGSEDGVRVGMAVVGQNDSQPSALVGIVEDVNPHTANVLLVTDVGSRISAYILYRNTSALGLVQGQWQHGSRLRLEQLDRVARLTPGTVVVSGGMTGELDLNLPLASVPRGIPIGTITTVLEDDGLTQFAELRPFVDPDQVRYVWIILNQEE